MQLIRCSVALAALALPVVLPGTVGGSDAPHVPVAVTAAPLLAPGVARTPRRAPAAYEPVALFSPGHGAHTAFQPATAPRELVLSFDDGPDLRGTPLILEELDKRGLKAIFFVTGWRLTGHRPEDVARRDLVRKIAAHGHLVANHTFSHHNLCRNPDEQTAEIDGNAKLIAATTGVPPLLFRSPYGAFCESLQDKLTARELPDIGWNIDPQDWKSDDEDVVFTYLTTKLSGLKGRGILLLHDTHLASVHALPRVLDWLARQNARDVRAGREPVEVIDYAPFVPRRLSVTTGLPELVGDLVSDAAGSVGRHLR
jgi:peptidoglycan/xylan/chitin deacetylase (PgdA/CDA1 family)